MKFEYEYYTLNNGLRVLLIPTKKVNSATISAYVKSGSSLELEEFQGITHFVEHVALTATKSWDTKAKLNEKSEFTGASYNGGTGRESLNYYINVPYREVEFGIQFIYEALYKCTLNPEYIEQERKIILDELSKHEDSISYQNSKFQFDALSKYKSAYTRSIGGTCKSVKNLTIDQIKNYYYLTHSPNKVLLTVIGNFKVESAKKQIQNLFENQEKTEEEIPYPTEGLKSKIVDIKNSPKTELTLTSVAFPSPSATEFTQKELEYINLWLSVLAGPMSSRLKARLREKENLLYSISADNTQFETFGFTGVIYGIPINYFKKTLNILLEELDKFIEKGPTEKELAHFKEYTINRKLIKYDNVYAYGGLIRSQIFWNLPVMELDEIIKTIRNATKLDIHNSIKKCMDMKNLNTLAFGNVNEEIKSIMTASTNKYL